MTHQLKPCAGGCGKTLRPARTTKAQHPGTVREEARGRCQPCYTVVKPPAGTPTKKPRTGVCKGCERPLRGRGVSHDEHPGTVVEYMANLCMTCWRHEKYGPPQPAEAGYDPWGDCAGCERPMRPHNATKADAPGTVKHHARGKCITCRRRELDPDMLDRPLIVGHTPTRPVKTVAKPEPVVEITDPGLLRLRAERNERRRRQEQAQRIRTEQEAVQRRFIAHRKQAA